MISKDKILSKKQKLTIWLNFLVIYFDDKIETPTFDQLVKLNS